MTNDEALAWFKELAGRELPIDTNTGEVPRNDVYDGFGRAKFATESKTVRTRNREAATEWVLEIGQALALCFPVGFELRVRWAQITNHAEGAPFQLASGHTVTAARATAKAAVRLLESGRLRTIWDGVRAETVAEVLDQAARLLDEGAPIASSTVLAGGALETHLRHLCERAGLLGLLKGGHGSLGKYGKLLKDARDAGNEVITEGDSSQAKVWAADRNLAARNPTKFTKSPDEVRLMVEGIVSSC